MAKQIALFNHKGGVSKTTTTFNLGWMLASKGHKVVIVDCDPQCNLTGMVLGFKREDEFEAIYKGDGIRNIRDGLAPAFESRPTPMEGVVCQPVEGQANMYLLPGHIGLAEYEVTLGIAQELSGSLITLQNLPGSLRHLLNLTATKYDAEFLLVDMSPSLGAINQNLLMTSDYFIIPMAPDYFSAMATLSLSSVLPKWSSWANSARTNQVLRKATYPFPPNTPKFLGTVIQKYRLRESKTPSKAFQKWIEEIEENVRTRLLPALAEGGLLLPQAVYVAAGVEPTKPLIQMSDYNSLIALSQQHKAPIFGLTDEQLGQTGVVLEITKKSMKQFRELYSEGADRIIEILKHA